MIGFQNAIHQKSRKDARTITLCLTTGGIAASQQIVEHHESDTIQCMKQMLTIVCKLQPTQEQTTEIEAALSGFAAGCNYINNTVNFKQTNNYQQWLNYNICRVTLDRAKSGNMVVAIRLLLKSRFWAGRMPTPQKLWEMSIEKLTSIRERTNPIPRSQTKCRLPKSWTFYQLRQFFDRKAIQECRRLVKVNHACTSQTYRQCNHTPRKIGKSYHQVKNFTCGHCGWQGDAGSSGVLNIPALGASVNRLGCSELSCSLSEHLRATKSPRHSCTQLGVG
jgi:Putative transposase DNA-binding domain